MTYSSIGSSKKFTIICPDYGEIGLLKELNCGTILEYEKKSKNPEKAFLSLLTSVVDDQVNINKLSEKDYDCLALHYSYCLKAKAIYQKAREDNNSVAISFSLSFLESPILKHLKEMSEDIYRIFFKLPKEIEIYIKRINQSNIIRTDPFNFQKFSTNLKIGIEESLAAFEKIIKTNGNIINSQNFSNLFKCVDLYSLEHVIKKWSFEFKNKFGIINSVLTNSVVLSKNTVFILRLNKVKKILEPTVSFHEQITFAIKEIFSIINTNINQIASAIKEVNLVLEYSELLVKETNNFFIQNSHIKLVRSEYKCDDNQLLDSLNSSETLLQDEASFSIIQSNIIVSKLAIEIESRLEKKLEEKFEPYINILERIRILEDSGSFHISIKDFVTKISKEHWEIFWEIPGKKFVQKPERYAKSLLSAFIAGRFEKIAFIGSEIKCGNGFIDLLVNFFGNNYIIELKMVGSTWSIGWAESGIEQLDNYMEVYNVDTSYLIVFDGRGTKCRKNLKDIYHVNFGTIHVINAKIFFN